MSKGQSFYFVRHGETDHNRIEGIHKGDHPEDISLNLKGREQAIQLEPLIASLPIQAVCASKMRRVQETKEIITRRLIVPHHEISGFSECSALIWKAMTEPGIYTRPSHEHALHFIEKVQQGLSQALALPNPCLIIAHGGVHWAICCLLNIRNHSWMLKNCGLVYFSTRNNQEWIAKSLE